MKGPLQNSLFAQNAHLPVAPRSKTTSILASRPARPGFIRGRCGIQWIVLLFTRFVWNLRALDRNRVLQRSLKKLIFLTATRKHPIGGFLVFIFIAILTTAFVRPVLASTASGQPTSLLKVVDRSRTLLQERLREHQVRQAKPALAPNREVPLDLVLAIWSRSEDTIKLYEVTKDKKKLKFSDASAPTVTLLTDNGVNSQFKVWPEGQAVVVGVVHPIFIDVSEGKQKLYELHERVYIPYQKEFYVPEVISFGSEYLSRLIKDAYDDVRARGVKSRAFPDKLLADAIDPYLVKTIAMIEHSDRNLFSVQEPERAVGKFLATLALNGEDAFGYSVSSAGARGLVQFMPKTYASLVKLRPELGLIEDFKVAMMDHTNAVKAQIALLDYDLSLMPTDIKKIYTTNPGEGARFLAAAYNGGGGRVRKTFKAFGEHWAEPVNEEREKLRHRIQQLSTDILLWGRQLKKGDLTKGQIAYTERAITKAKKEKVELQPRYEKAKVGGLKAETVQYVKKFDKVYTMLQGGWFSTPNTVALEVLAQR